MLVFESGQCIVWKLTDVNIDSNYLVVDNNGDPVFENDVPKYSTTGAAMANEIAEVLREAAAAGIIIRSLVTDNAA